MSLNDTGFDYQGSVSSNWANGEISRRDAIIATQDSELSTLRAENERLRERCEAAERIINSSNYYYFDMLDLYCREDGKWTVENIYSEDVGWHHSATEAYQAAIAAGWISSGGDQ